jgi:6-hydroxycyclohex-1-ene-1-carbonyl-CoA dehydrogenase
MGIRPRISASRKTGAAVQLHAWTVVGAGRPMELALREERPGPGEVLVRVAGCGVCHTDLGFYYDGVPTGQAFPLTLGHEISGTVVEAGEAAGEWVGRQVIVPAVIACGECAACRAGRPGVCPRQVFPGSDVHGGFASHVRVPARGLCPVPDLTRPAVNPQRLTLEQLSVVADAVSTPYQAVRVSGLEAGDLAVFVGAGGIGGFGVQIAAAFGAVVAAIDVDPARLALAAEHGATLALDARTLDFKALRDALRGLARERGIPGWRQRIFETSGTTAGQATAFGLLERGGYLGVVGFTRHKLELRLSNLMALEATAQGNWGCAAEHYPAILELVLAGRVRLAPFVETRPLSGIQQAFADVHERRVARRLILVPEP